MYLKSLTLRGFKSFAASTTLRFEPGMTCVVGPNGSGKSNVVDAIAWVLGEQGAKSLRGGKMEDVIFAGTSGSSGRPPLGRAEVLLTIDNTDGALPIDYREVTVSRLMYRTGASEYAINGTTCRLLDVQELLSDTGIGREMHVIVGQGQLDAVLASRPEDRRGFVEEASGVLKHRRRKEKALRKMDAMAANLTRVSDLVAELKRRIGPLSRQADAARRAVVVQADLRDARARLLADDLVELWRQRDTELADEQTVRLRQDRLAAELAVVRSEVDALEAAAADAVPRLAAAVDATARLAALRERFRAVRDLADERDRNLSTEQMALPADGRDPDELDREARDARQREAAADQECVTARSLVAEAVTARRADETTLAEAERAVLAAARASADHRERVARLAGEVAAARSRTTAAEAEIARLSGAAADARRRSESARAEFGRDEAEIAGLGGDEAALDATFERADDALRQAADRLAALQEQERGVERARAAALARRDALDQGLRHRDGGGALLAEPVEGVLGALAAEIAVRAGAEAAVSAALGPAADAVVVAGLDAAAAAVARLRATDSGRAVLVVASGPTAAAEEGPVGEPGRPSGSNALPGGGEWLLDLVDVPAELRAVVEGLLADTVLVADLAEAVAAVAAAPPGWRAVTPDGDLVSAGVTVGGPAGAPGAIEMAAAAEAARQEVVRLGQASDRLRFAISAAGTDRDAAAEAADAALVRLHESDAAMSAVAERLAQLGHAAKAAAAEADRLGAAQSEAERALSRHAAAAAAAQDRLEAAQAAPAPDPAGGPDERPAAAAACERSRGAETEARLALRTAEERARAVAGRADRLSRQADQERTARRERAGRLARRAAAAQVARRVARLAAVALTRVDALAAVALAERRFAEQERERSAGELTRVRVRASALTEEHAEVTEALHRDEVARSALAQRVETLERRALEEFATDPAELVADYGPDQPVPVPDADPVRYERAVQQARAAAAEQALAKLGRVNPLALEEFAALEERHRFLSQQLADLTATRRDLLTVVKEVDERVREVFASAFADTAREFEDVFATLFPGGYGRLTLTDPDDLLATGIEVEARPAGKKVQRLSLLSGGERSLVAIALLVAIFRARPSPFYVLDEVEAALDDRNLDRLVSLLDHLRLRSQLVVVTHQKTTMDAADALYGVTMRGDGVTAVISQRLREREPVRV